MTRRVKKIFSFFFFILFLITLSARAQENNNTDPQQLYNTARKFISSGDYANAILVLNQAIQADPANPAYQEELALTYYLSKNYDRAQEIINPLIKNDAASARTYQVAGSIYLAQQDDKSAQKIYEKGIKKFPNSGQLYSDMGLLYFSQQKYEEALRNWIKGIEMAPEFGGNYYNAARTYYYSKDKMWTIIYGEIFIDLEGFTLRTAEIKGILLDAYKKLFSDPQLLSGDALSQNDNENFHTAFLKTLSKQSSVISNGIFPETLIMLRTRFILDWYNTYADKYPFALFDYERDLLKQGLFETYNQWIFGPAADQAAYKNWLQVHQDEMQQFLDYHKAHPLQLRQGEFYNEGKISFDSKISSGK